VKDLYEEYLMKTKINSQKELLIARLSSGLLGILGIILAIILPNIIDLLLLTYNLWAPGIILPVVVGIFARQEANRENNLIFSTMLVSTLATILYMLTPYRQLIQPSVWGVGISILVYFFAKSISKRKPRRSNHTNTG
jgi:SSS family solute:Na+ symporter